MSLVGNRLDRIIKIFESRVGFTQDDRNKVFDELKKIKDLLCCLPKCEDFCLEVVDEDGNIIDQNLLNVCTSYELDFSACLSIMQADFVSSVQVEDINTDITFTDLTNNSPTNWHWDFGDGNTSTLQNPTHQYAGYGLYTVTLMSAKDGAGDIETKIDYIEIADPDGL
jgi:hypothetical protein